MFWFDFSWQLQALLNDLWWQIQLMLLIILVILGYLAIKKPVYAAGLTVALLPTYLFRSQIFFLPFTFLELCIWIMFLGWLIRKILKRSSLSISKDNQLRIIKTQKNNNNQQLALVSLAIEMRWSILLILISSTISVFISPNLITAAGLWKAYFIEPILFFVILANIIKSEHDREVIIWSLGFSALLISLFAIFQKFTGFAISEPGWVGQDHRRVTSIFSSPNAVGLFLGPVILIYFGWLISEIKKWKRSIVKIFILGILGLAVYFTKSQGTMVAVIGGLIFFIFFSNSASVVKKIGTKKIIYLLILAGLISALTAEPIKNKILPVITFQDHAGQNRVELAKMSLNYLNQNPKNFVLGAGIFGFPQIQDRLRDPLEMEPLIYPHNIIFNFWLEIGLIGLAAFTLMIIKFYRRGFKVIKISKLNKQKFTTLAVMAAMTVILIHGLVDVPYFKNDLAVLFWIVIALLP